MANRLLSTDWGETGLGSGGSATLGYKVFNAAGSVLIDDGSGGWKTSTVNEVPASSGQYQAEEPGWDYNWDYAQVVFHDTAKSGASSYASEGIAKPQIIDAIDSKTSKLSFDANNNLQVKNTGDGDTLVDHNTADDSGNTMEVEDSSGNGIGQVDVIAYLKSNYDAGNFVQKARTETKDDGTWKQALSLSGGITYTIRFEKPDEYQATTVEVTP